jgi:hypothetical protein
MAEETRTLIVCDAHRATVHCRTVVIMTLVLA